MLAHRLTADAELRALEPWRAEEFATFVDHAREHLAPWLPWATSITDAAGARRFLQRYADLQAHDSGRIYGIWQRDELVGGALFRTFDTTTGICEIGVWLAAHAEGQGLVTRAATHMIDWAVGVRGMARVEWYTTPSNGRSIAVAKRLGMSRDGVLRQAFVVAEERQDMEVWSVLAHEWRSLRATRADEP